MSIMLEFGHKVGGAWTDIVRTDSTTVEKLDALSWLNINALDQFPDEFRIQLAWLRQSPPDTPAPAWSYTTRIRQMKALLSEGIRSGDIEIDSGGMTLTVRGQLTQTTATEFRLLEYLARHPGRVFTRDQLLDAVWRDTHYVTPRSVDVYVRRIREKIEENPDEPRYLKTVRGAGYRFEIPKS